MFIRQAELFEGISADAKRVIERQGMELSFKAGAVVFEEGYEAPYFYILEEGKVDLFVGKQEEKRFLVYYPGEIFGWSALVEPHRYLASARCMADTIMTRIPRQAVDIVLKEYPSDGQLIYQHLAAILAQRLIEAYRESVPQSGIQAPSYG